MGEERVIKSREEVTIRNWSTAVCLKIKACVNVPEINEKPENASDWQPCC